MINAALLKKILEFKKKTNLIISIYVLYGIKAYFSED